MIHGINSYLIQHRSAIFWESTWIDVLDFCSFILVGSLQMPKHVGFHTNNYIL
jgi:hypothetical protein